jgi:hypothetical protein
MPKLTSTATPDGAEPQRRKPLRGAELKRRSTLSCDEIGAYFKTASQSTICAARPD